MKNYFNLVGNKGQIKEILVLETWKKTADGVVYQVWELPTGEKIERPTPLEDIPFIKVDYNKFK